MSQEDNPQEVTSSSIEPWLAAILHKFEVTTIEASFSGSGDEGHMDDLILTLRDGAEGTEDSVWKSLKELKVRSAESYRKSLYDILEEKVEKDADPVGNYSDNEGGAVYLQIAISEDAAEVIYTDYTPGSYDDEYDDEEEPEYEDDFDPGA
ncbi:hypothetical protein AB9K35_16820 [Leisingera sp. XS_AS12]|uniref:hypothetical protein n=1 Tax=Leisingera sp. XS_AS12 TaxID=3241294 RepID=UPI0035194645